MKILKIANVILAIAVGLMTLAGVIGLFGAVFEAGFLLTIAGGCAVGAGAGLMISLGILLISVILDD